MSKPKLMIPGPVDISESVRQAMSVAAMPHYGDAWVELYGETREMARQIFQTDQDLYIVFGPGTLALEIAMASTMAPGDEVLIPSNGFFGDRLITVAEGHALKPVVIRSDSGEPITAKMVDRALTEHPDVKAVLLVHHETSMALINPLEAIAAVTRAHDKLIIVDAVSSLGGIPLPVDDWDIDLCVTVANKALETPPGLSLLSVSERAWDVVEARTSPCGWYTDLKTWKWYADNWSDWHPTPVTMPTSNLHALHHSLKQILADGIEVRYDAYAAAARAVREGLRALGFDMLVGEAFASPLTTAFCIPEQLDADDLKTSLEKDAKIMVSGGIGDLRGRILRVGHIGQARKRDYVVSFLLGVEDYVRAAGWDIVTGSSLVALEGLEI